MGNIKYKCFKCGNITSSKNCSNPNAGDYTRVKCSCGNKGSSAFEKWYQIRGFRKVT